MQALIRLGSLCMIELLCDAGLQPFCASVVVRLDTGMTVGNDQRRSDQVSQSLIMATDCLHLDGSDLARRLQRVVGP